MDQDSKVELSRSFDLKREKLYQSLTNEDINSYIYILGVTLESRHLVNLNLRLVRNYAEKYKPLWDNEIWRRVTWGTDDLKQEEVYNVEFDKALSKMAYYDFLFIQSQKYNRPAWSIFGLIGMMQGTLNENNFEVSNPENKLNKNDFVRCLKYLSDDFLEKFSADLMHLFSYFDERGYRLNISTDGNEVAVSIDDIIDG